MSSGDDDQGAVAGGGGRGVRREGVRGGEHPDDLRAGGGELRGGQLPLRRQGAALRRGGARGASVRHRDARRVEPFQAGRPRPSSSGAYIHHFLGHVLAIRPRRPRGTGLMLREMIQPTPASEVLVREAIRPRFERLVGILRRSLPRGRADEAARPGVQRDRPVPALQDGAVDRRAARRQPRLYEALDLDYLTDHITSFCLAALGWRRRSNAAGERRWIRRRPVCRRSEGGDDVLDRAQDAGRRQGEVLRDRPGPDLRRAPDHPAGVDLLRPDAAGPPGRSPTSPAPTSG